ncbi:12983_t:CDS:2 [Racocetra persica]|uniref:12983_t:CDS:1 n=1 Tax=Racocetra persica TaxID=160502 RepID=A0ACA9Q6P0_9GLOM|nr:12983_t:CDS:2 [Racocetra persica]
MKTSGPEKRKRMHIKKKKVFTGKKTSSKYDEEFKELLQQCKDEKTADNLAIYAKDTKSSSITFSPKSRPKSMPSSEPATPFSVEDTEPTLRRRDTYFEGSHREAEIRPSFLAELLNLRNEIEALKNKVESENKRLAEKYKFPEAEEEEIEKENNWKIFRDSAYRLDVIFGKQIKALESDIKKLNKLINQQEKSIKALEKQIEEKDAKITELQDNNKTLSSKNTNLTTENSNLKKEKGIYSARLDKIKDEGLKIFKDDGDIDTDKIKAILQRVSLDDIKKDAVERLASWIVNSSLNDEQVLAQLVKDEQVRKGKYEKSAISGLRGDNLSTNKNETIQRIIAEQQISTTQEENYINAETVKSTNELAKREGVVIKAIGEVRQVINNKTEAINRLNTNRQAGTITDADLLNELKTSHGAANTLTN